MDLKQIIEDAIESGLIYCIDQRVFDNDDYQGNLKEFVELTLKRASLSANEQDAIDAERYRYIKERVYSDMESWTLPEIEEPKDYKYSIKVSRFDYAVDKAIANKKGGV